jgi:hypothetical protein
VAHNNRFIFIVKSYLKKRLNKKKNLPIRGLSTIKY